SSLIIPPPPTSTLFPYTTLFRSTILFAATPLDIAAARVFYRSDALDHWPLAKEPPWSVLYGLAPWITASLVIVGLAALAAGLVRSEEHTSELQSRSDLVCRLLLE